MENNLYNYLKKKFGFPFIVKESFKARRVSIRIREATGVVSITLPRGVDASFLAKFVEKHTAWIQKNLAKTVKPEMVRLGVKLPIEGSLRELALDRNLHCDFEILSDKILLKTVSPTCGVQVQRALISRSRVIFADLSFEYAERLEVKFSKISIKDPKSRWASCSSSGALMYSWRLIMAPSNIIRYVVAHEIAHLLHLNHSKDFWSVVHSLCPNYNAHRLWLRSNGKNLHKFVF